MDNNIYYNPEKFGLEVVDSLEYSSGCYEFDTRVIWKQKATGKLLTLADSGCSCPTPFESYGIEDADDITENYEWFLKNEWTEADSYRKENVSKADLEDVIESCRRALQS